MANGTRPEWVTVMIEKMERTIEALDKAGVAEWVELFRHPRRLLVINFFSGVARGFGIAVGFYGRQRAVSHDFGQDRPPQPPARQRVCR